MVRGKVDSTPHSEVMTTVVLLIQKLEKQCASRLKILIDLMDFPKQLHQASLEMEQRGLQNPPTLVMFRFNLLPSNSESRCMMTFENLKVVASS